MQDTFILSGGLMTIVDYGHMGTCLINRHRCKGGYMYYSATLWKLWIIIFDFHNLITRYRINVLKDIKDNKYEIINKVNKDE